ncbi:MAG TPA: DUF420 domain-containing protein [Gemmatimonadales bacterium]|nr:DUF420 domain-containing protein [Gemmatimonadales bacterium]
MPDIYDLPAVSAALNGISAACLVTAYALARRRRTVLHRTFILLALACSALFLASYLRYHAAVGPVRPGWTGPARTAYLVLLGSHSALAMIVPLLLAGTIGLALRGDRVRHRRLGRLTLGAWLYVSVTGVAVFFLLRTRYPGREPRPLRQAASDARPMDLAATPLPPWTRERPSPPRAAAPHSPQPSLASSASSSSFSRRWLGDSSTNAQRSTPSRSIRK